MNDELNDVIQRGKDMASLMENDKFKRCITDEFDKLSLNLVSQYVQKGDDVKKMIEYQMTMISGFKNFCEGTVAAGQMAEVQLEEYSRELEEETNA